LHLQERLKGLFNRIQKLESKTDTQKNVAVQEAPPVVSHPSSAELRQRTPQQKATSLLERVLI
jgi:hypothetical protein